MERALKALRQVILLAGLLVVVALVLGLPGFAFAFCLVLTLVLSIATLLMVSLIQGLVFNYVTDYIGGRRSDYGNLLGRSLTSLESLFRLNVVLYIGLALGALIVFPFSLQTELYSFMGAGTPGDPSVPFWLAVRVARYFSPIFALATVCAPFFLVAGGLGVRQTLRVNFGFIGRHFLKYLTLLAVSTCLLFIPRLLRVLLGTVFLPMTAPDFVIRFILALLSVIIAVRVFLAVFRFHHDYAQR